MKPLVTRGAMIALLLSCFFATGYADTPREPTAVIEEMRHDLGRVYESDSYQYAFKVKNTGTVELQITDVKPTCGCTVAKFDTVIAPGGEGIVTLDVAGDQVDGEWLKEADVYTNDPKHPKLSITIGGTVLRYVTVEPKRVHLRGGYGEPANADIDIFSSELGADFEVVSVTSDVDDKITYDVAAASEPGHYKIRLYKNPRLPTLNEWGSVFIKTNSAQTPDKVVQVNVVTRGAIIVQPSSVNFGTLSDENATPIQKSITLSKTRGEFQIREVEFTDPAYQASVEPIEAGKKYRLTVNFRPTDLEDRSRVDAMIIRTDDPNEPSIRIRLISRGAI